MAPSRRRPLHGCHAYARMERRSALHGFRKPAHSCRWNSFVQMKQTLTTKSLIKRILRRCAARKWFSSDALDDPGFVLGKLRGQLAKGFRYPAATKREIAAEQAAIKCRIPGTLSAMLTQ